MKKIVITLLAIATIFMATWKANDYKGSGLSKAAYLAKQSAPKKTSTKATASKTPNGWGALASSGGGYGTDPSLESEMGYIATPQYQAEVTANKGKPTSNKDFKQKNDSYNKSKAKSVASKPIVLNTPSAPTGLNVSTRAQAASTTSPYRGWIDKGLDIAKNLPIANGIARGVEAFGGDVTDLLGIPKEQAAFEDYTAPQAINDQQNFFETGNQLQDMGFEFSDAGRVNIPASQQNINQRYSAPTQTQPQQRSARQVSQPTPTPFSAPSTNLSSIFQQPTPQPDYTPTQQDQGTVRQFLGNGYLSNGAASNGKGDYGIEGAMTGTGGNGAIDELLTILGIKPQTAQASMGMESFGMQPNAVSSWAQPQYGYSGMGSQGLGQYNPDNSFMSAAQLNASNKDDKPPVTTPPPGPTGNPTQQYAQQTPGQQQQQQFDNSGYKAAQKAQKKALDELIKSIKGQYSQSTTEGTQALEKSKQQDLLRLSGLMGFANQSPDSEQRIQYEQRTNSDYAGQLTDLLNKLAQGQSKDISGAKQGYQSSLADILQQQAQAQQSYQDQQWDRNYKMMALNKKSGSGTKANYKQVGVNSQNQPVYRDFNTGQEWVGAGLTPSLGATPQLQQDENGNWYYEQ